MSVRSVVEKANHKNTSTTTHAATIRPLRVPSLSDSHPPKGMPTAPSTVHRLTAKAATEASMPAASRRYSDQ